MVARDALLSGTVGSVLSTLVLAACGRAEAGTASGPSNGPSQWVYGESSAHRRDATLRHTLVGYLIHHAMSVLWALPFEAAVAGRRRTGRSRRFAPALATAGLACLVDYRCTPRRLRPGFEKQLGRTSLALVYTAFGIGLALGTRERRGSRYRFAADTYSATAQARRMLGPTLAEIPQCPAVPPVDRSCSG